MQTLKNVLRNIPRQRWLWAILVFVVLMALYIRTLLPGVVGGDAGELQYAGPLLALTHPTGQPLYVTLGFLWSHLIPIGTVAWRMNLLAAVSGAAGCVFLTWIIHRLYGGPITSVAAGLTLGFGASFWGQAVIADKYAFSGFMASVVTGLALWWAAEHERPHGNKLLYALSLAYGLSLLHHRSMFMFAPGLGLLVGFIERKMLWKNLRRTLICAGLVLLPSLIIFPLFLPLVRARELSPQIWQPDTFSEWINWWLERHVLTGEVLVFDSTTGWAEQMLTYARTLRLDYTMAVIAVAGFGLVLISGRQPMSVVFLVVTYGLVGALGANFRGNDRQFTYYLPSFVVMGYTYGIGMGEMWQFVRARLAKPIPVRVMERLAAVAVVTGVLLVQFARSYPLRRIESLYGEPLDVFRQALKTGNMGDRLAAGMADLPEDAVVISDWEQETVLWYRQKVEGVRPDLELIYPIDRLADYADGDLPVCLSRTLPVGEEWHPTSVGALACLSREPVMESPEGFTPLGTALFTPEGEPRLELSAYRLDAATFSAGRYVPILLSWRALADHPEDYSISLHILTEQWESVWSQDISAPVLGMYPTSRWVEGEVVQDYHEFAIPREMPPGRYLWTVVVYRQLEDGSFVQLRDANGNIEVLGGTLEVLGQ